VASSIWILARSRRGGLDDELPEAAGLAVLLVGADLEETGELHAVANWKRRNSLFHSMQGIQQGSSISLSWRVREKVRNIRRRIVQCHVLTWLLSAFLWAGAV
jgi:hypothetical protein